MPSCLAERHPGDVAIWDRAGRLDVGFIRAGNCMNVSPDVETFAPDARGLWRVTLATPLRHGRDVRAKRQRKGEIA